MSSIDWASLKVVDLKAELQSRSLSTKGVKADLVKRLTEADAEAATTAAASKDQEAAVSPNGDIAKPADDAPQGEDAVSQNSSKANSPAIKCADVKMTDDAPNAIATQSESAIAVPEVHDPAAKEPAETQPDTNKTSLPPSVPAHDAYLDLQKRKRRSSTPPPSTKRAKQEEELHAEEQEDVVDYETGDLSGSPEKKSLNGAEKGGLEETGAVERESHPAAETTAIPAQNAAEASENQADLANATATEPSKAHSVSQSQEQNPGLDMSGDDAFMRRVAIGRHSEAPSQTSHHPCEDRSEMDQEPSRESAHPDAGHSPPSAHPPTSALYIRELMRPLRSETVEEYIVDLVTPQGGRRDSSLIEDFYLDQIRTHAFVKLASVSAAQRVRAALHTQVWPNERNRKPLWVDFIPPDSMREWVGQEESGARGNSQRWEVVYEQDGDRVVAVHRAVGLDNKSFSKPPPTGPAAGSGPVYPGIEAAPRGPRGRGGPPIRLNNPNLLQTHANPPLSYQPLSEDIAQRRVENMRSFYSSIPSYDLGKDYHRYTFENSHSFVDRGTEVFIGIRPPHREKEHQERLRLERLGLAGAGGGADAQPRREDHRASPRPNISDFDRYSSDRRFGFGGDRRPRNRGFRGDRGPQRFRGEDPYRYRPGY